MKFKQLTLAISAALLANGAMAASNIMPVGSNLGYGDAGNINSVFAIANNPAWVSANLQNENNYGLGLSAGLLVKQNAFSDLYNQYQDNVDPILKKMDENANSGQNQSVALATDLKTQVNNLVLDVRDKFYTQFNGNFSLPIQISHNTFGGIGMELSGLAQGRERLLSSNRPVEIDANYLLQNPNASRDDIVNNGLIIQSALYTKTAQYAEGALTYGNQFYENEYGTLSVGIRAKFMQAKLRKVINDLGTYLKSNDDVGAQISDDISNTLEEGDFENAVGFDIGVMWLNPNWKAGFTLLNVNSPSFNYNTLGVGPITDNQANVERFYAGQIDLSEKVELKIQGRLEGAIYTKDNHWTLAGSIDTNESNDLLNNPYQWATVSASYATAATLDEWWYALVPDFRIGYRANLTGDERTYITPGFTWGPVNLDIAFHSFEDFSKTSEDDLPEGFAVNLGLELYF
jgi:hypothetical protein